MKRLLIPLAILAAFVFAATSIFAKNIFSDIKDSPYKASIEYLAKQAIVKGNPDGTFKPTATMNRAEFTTMMVQAFSEGKEIGKRKNCFSDVGNEWFARFICFAKKTNLVSGYPDGTFKPAGSVSYVEALAIGIKAANIATAKKSEKEGWYKPYLEFAHTNNIFSKYDLLPDAALSREKAAYILHQILLIKSGEKKLAVKRENFSAGCGKNPPRTAPKSSLVNGASENYITVIPDEYDKNAPAKLVFAFHGRTNSNVMVRGYYKVEQASEGEAIFIYPEGTKARGGYTWRIPQDYELFDQLLSEFSQKYCIDLDHVYVVGHSLGGWFTSQLGCARGEVIRAIANVGGGGSPQKDCNGPVAAMIWHNPKDNLVAFSQGEIARDKVRAQNQCGAKTKSVEPKSAKCVAYDGCAEESPLLWCPHTEDYAGGRYYPHTWPKNAGKEIWKFFESFK